MRFEINSHDLDAAAAKFEAGLMSAGEVALKSHAGEAAKQMALVTPPGDMSVQGIPALMRGRMSVLSNTLRVVLPVRGKVVGAPSIESVVRGNWVKGGTRRLAKRVIVTRDAFENYMRAKRPAVGYTAGGFMAAAHALGAQLPAWIENVPGPGSVSVASDGERLEILFSNDVPWIGELAGLPARLVEVVAAGETPWLASLAEVVGIQASAAGF